MKSLKNLVVEFRNEVLNNWFTKSLVNESMTTKQMIKVVAPAINQNQCELYIENKILNILFKVNFKGF